MKELLAFACGAAICLFIYAVQRLVQWRQKRRR